MKYSFCFLLVASCLLLTGCFEKKQAQDLQVSLSGSSQQENTGADTSLVGEETLIATGSTQTETPETISPPSSQNSGSTSSGTTYTPEEQQVIVEETQEDLEALFDNLMKSD